MLIGILVTTLIGIPMGVTEFKGVLSSPAPIGEIFCKFEWEHVFTLDMVVVVFTFLFIDMFDTVGTLVGVCTKAGLVNEDGTVKKIKEAFMADAIAPVLIMVGLMMLEPITRIPFDDFTLKYNIYIRSVKTKSSAMC